YKYSKRKTWKDWHNEVEKTTENTVKCKLCSTNLSYHNSTTTMHSHFKAKHPSELQQRAGRDPVSQVRELAVGQPEEVWNAVAHPELLHRHRDLAWLAAHGVLSVQGVLHARRLARTAKCPWPRCEEEESVRHCLWDCPVARTLWAQCGPLIQLLLGAGRTLQCQTVLYGVGRGMDTRKWRCLWLAINCFKQAIWSARTVCCPVQRSSFLRILLVILNSFVWFYQ
ncbi:hypothetical protein COCON_G00161930, partial [Conger conger]